MTTSAILSDADLAIDRELARVSESFRFLLDVTPVDVEEHRRAFLQGTVTEPSFTYRPLEDEPKVARAVLDAVPVADVEEPTLGHLLRAKQRELDLKLDMLAARGTSSTPSHCSIASMPPPRRQTATASTPRGSRSWPRPSWRTIAPSTLTSASTSTYVPTPAGSWSPGATSS